MTDANERRVALLPYLQSTNDGLRPMRRLPDKLCMIAMQAVCLLLLFYRGRSLLVMIFSFLPGHRSSSIRNQVRHQKCLLPQTMLPRNNVKVLSHGPRWLNLGDAHHCKETTLSFNQVLAMLSKPILEDDHKHPQMDDTRYCYNQYRRMRASMVQMVRVLGRSRRRFNVLIPGPFVVTILVVMHYHSQPSTCSSMVTPTYFQLM